VIDRDWGPRHPTTAQLVIEVALSSRERDLTLKPRLYAPAVDEYWVLDLSHDHVVAHRGASTDGYRDVTIHGRDSELDAQHAALGPLRVADLIDAIS
jgi:Uma2 family endonuclease